MAPLIQQVQNTGELDKKYCFFRKPATQPNRKTHRQTERQTNRRTHTQTDGRTDGQIDDRLTNWQTDWLADWETLSISFGDWIEAYFHLFVFYYTFTYNNHCSSIFFSDNIYLNQKWQLLHRSIDEWDVSKITTMTGLFMNKDTCNPDISKWNTSSVTSFVSQFIASTSI